MSGILIFCHRHFYQICCNSLDFLAPTKIIKMASIDRMSGAGICSTNRTDYDNSNFPLPWDTNEAYDYMHRRLGIEGHIPLSLDLDHGKQVIYNLMKFRYGAGNSEKIAGLLNKQLERREGQSREESMIWGAWQAEHMRKGLLEIKEVKDVFFQGTTH